MMVESICEEGNCLYIQGVHVQGDQKHPFVSKTTFSLFHEKKVSVLSVYINLFIGKNIT